MSLTDNNKKLILLALDISDEALTYFARIVEDCNVENRRPNHCGEFDNCALCQCVQKFALEHKKQYPHKHQKKKDENQ